MNRERIVLDTKTTQTPYGGPDYENQYVGEQSLLDRIPPRIKTGVRAVIAPLVGITGGFALWEIAHPPAIVQAHPGDSREGELQVEAIRNLRPFEVFPGRRGDQGNLEVAFNPSTGDLLAVGVQSDSRSIPGAGGGLVTDRNINIARLIEGNPPSQIDSRIETEGSDNYPQTAYNAQAERYSMVYSHEGQLRIVAITPEAQIIEGSGRIIAPAGGGLQSESYHAVDPQTGNALVVWQEKVRGQSGVFAQEMDPNFNKIGEPVKITDLGQHPRVLFDPESNDYKILWANMGGYMSSFQTQEVRQVSPYRDDFPYELANNGGITMIVWEERLGIYAQVLDRDMNPIRERFPVIQSQLLLDEYKNPSITKGANSREFYVALQKGLYPQEGGALIEVYRITVNDKGESRSERLNLDPAVGVAPKIIYRHPGEVSSKGLPGKDLFSSRVEKEPGEADELFLFYKTQGSGEWRIIGQRIPLSQPSQEPSL